MQVAQRSFNRGPDMDPGAQRQERLNGLRNGASEIQDVNRAATRAEGTQMYTNLNKGPSQTMAELMRNPQAKQIINQMLVQANLPSFQWRTDWVNQNPALARQVIEATRAYAPNLANTAPNRWYNTMPNGQFNVGGVNINRQQTGGYAHGMGAANEAGSIGG